MQTGLQAHFRQLSSRTCSIVEGCYKLFSSTGTLWEAVAHSKTPVQVVAKLCTVAQDWTAINHSRMRKHVVAKAFKGHRLCVLMQEVLAAAAGGALHLRQRQAAPAASQLHRWPLRLCNPDQGRPAFPAHPLPAIFLLHTTPSCSSRLHTSPGATHVLSFMLATSVTTPSASCILSCAV